MRRLPIAGVLAIAALLCVHETVASGRAEDPFHGVWIGTFDVKAGGGTLQYPVLLNLGMRSAGSAGLILLADDLAGEPGSLDFEAIAEIDAKGKKLTLTVEVGSDNDEQTLTFKFRLKRGALAGKVSSSNKGFKGGKSRLVAWDAEQPLQHVWTGSSLSSRGAADAVALFVLGGSKPGGAGFIGERFGALQNVVLDGDRMTATLSTKSGDTELDLELDKKGHLRGLATDAFRGDLVLLPGHTAAPPSITKVTPAQLAAGKSTSLTIAGKDLAPGFLLQTDTEGIQASAPVVDNAKKATVSVFVDSDVPPGTKFSFDIATAAGMVDAARPSLSTGAGGAVSFKDDLQPIFTTTCALSGCHVTPPLDDPAYPAGTEAAGGMVLSHPESYSNLVGVPAKGFPALNRVEPGDPERSYIVKKLRGDPDIEGGRMPDGGPYLSAAVIDLFIQWIEAGAKKN